MTSVISPSSRASSPSSTSNNNDYNNRARILLQPYTFVFLGLLLLVFALTSLTVALVQRNSQYATTPASEWILLGGLTHSSAEFRVLIATDNNGNSNNAFLRVSKQKDLENAVFSQSVNDDDKHGIQAITVTNLKPDTDYFYGLVVVVDKHKNTRLPGRFHTSVAPGTPWNFTIALGGDAETGSKHSVFDVIAATEPRPHLFLHVGDIHYEDIRSNHLQTRIDALSTVLASPSQARLYRSTALVYMWDDHDWLGNNRHGYDAEPGARETALQSYQIAFPHYPLAAASTNNSSSLITTSSNSSSTNKTTTTSATTVPVISPYHAFTVGTVRFVVSDLRSESNDERIMSDAQRTWLRNEFQQAARYSFVIWITGKPWVGDAEIDDGSSDAWFGVYADERREWSEFIAREIGGDSGPQNLLAVSADAHMLAFDDGSHTYYGNNTTTDDADVVYSFPILQTAALDQYGSVKGGPFTEGCTSTKYERNHQYSTISFQIPTRENEKEACIEIKAYRVGLLSRKKLVFSKRLCGKIFQPSRSRQQQQQQQGSCDLQLVSTASTALFWTAIGLTLVETLLLMLLSSSFWNTNSSKTVIGSMMLVTVMIWLGLGITLAFGIGIPLHEDFPYVDRLPTMIILTVQACVVGAYLLYQIIVPVRAILRMKDDNKAPGAADDSRRGDPEPTMITAVPTQSEEISENEC